MKTRREVLKAGVAGFVSMPIVFGSLRTDADGPEHRDIESDPDGWMHLDPTKVTFAKHMLFVERTDNNDYRYSVGLGLPQSDWERIVSAVIKLRAMWGWGPTKGRRVCQQLAESPWLAEQMMGEWKPYYKCIVPEGQDEVMMKGHRGDLPVSENCRKCLCVSPEMLASNYIKPLLAPEASRDDPQVFLDEGIDLGSGYGPGAYCRYVEAKNLKAIKWLGKRLRELGEDVSVTIMRD